MARAEFMEAWISPIYRFFSISILAVYMLEPFCKLHHVALAVVLHHLLGRLRQSNVRVHSIARL
jgi:hypothetical protein